MLVCSAICTGRPLRCSPFPKSWVSGSETSGKHHQAKHQSRDGKCDRQRPKYSFCKALGPAGRHARMLHLIFLVRQWPGFSWFCSAGLQTGILGFSSGAPRAAFARGSWVSLLRNLQLTTDYRELSLCAGPSGPAIPPRPYPFSSSNFFNLPYPARLTGNFTPFVNIATLLSFPYGSIRATRSRFTKYDR